METRYKRDLFVFGGIVVELKAVAELAPEHEAQLFNYMRIARQGVGYLINFGPRFTVTGLLSGGDHGGVPEGKLFVSRKTSTAVIQIFAAQGLTAKVETRVQALQGPMPMLFVLLRFVQRAS